MPKYSHHQATAHHPTSSPVGHPAPPPFSAPHIPNSNTNPPALATSSAIQHTPNPLPVHLKNNPFTGPPRPELDAAWHDLFEDVRIRVTRADLDFYGVDSVRLRDGSGFVAELGVWHELHCLVSLGSRLLWGMGEKGE